MDGGHNTKDPRQIGPSVEEIFRFLSIFTTGGMYFGMSCVGAKELGGAEASYAILGEGGPSGIRGLARLALSRIVNNLNFPPMFRCSSSTTTETCDLRILLW